jgi:outer membrane lipase/esterase
MASFRRPVLAALTLGLMATSALAQQRYVAFGDSLSDNGNFFIGSFGAAPPPPYVNGRFSNGPTWVEQLNGAPMAGFFPIGPINNNVSTNFAFGGARTDDSAAIPAVNPALNPLPNVSGGTRGQIETYRLGGGAFGGNTIATLWGGANDIFQGLNAITNPATAQATMQGISAAAANNIATQTGRLASLGARTVIVMNLPDFASLPTFIALGGSAQALAGISSTTFNSTLEQALGPTAAANPNANIIRIDTAALFTALRANASGLGFTNVDQACIPAGLATGCAGYAFFDGVHPTTAGHAVIAAAVRQYMAAPVLTGVYSALGEHSIEQRRISQNRAFDRLDAARLGATGVNNFFVGVFGDSGVSDATGNRPGTRSSNFGVNFGMDRALTSNWAMTASGTIGLGSLRAGGILSSETINAALDAAAIYHSGPFFAKAGFGAGLVNYGDLERKTVAPLVNKAGTTSFTYNLALEAGTLHSFGAFDISPRARLSWLSGNIASITETGAVAPLAIRAHSANALAGGAELRAAYHFVNTPTQRTSVTALVGYERYLTYEGNALQARLANNTAQGFRNVTGDPRGPGLILGVGVSSATARGFTVSADYRASIGASNTVRHTGQISLKAAF